MLRLLPFPSSAALRTDWEARAFSDSLFKRHLKEESSEEETRHTCSTAEPSRRAPNFDAVFSWEDSLLSYV